MDRNNHQQNEVWQAVVACREHVMFAGLFSAAINLLLLTPIIYMLTVYDRVVSSGSLSTLAMLTLLMVALLLAVGGFEWVRSMMLIGFSNKIEENLQKRISDATFKRSLLTGGMVNNAQPINDLNSLRQFASSNGLFAFFDAPWFPIYIFVMFLFHPWFGAAGIFSAAVMVALAVANNAATNETLKDANEKAVQSSSYFQSSLRNAEVVEAMGMSEDLAKKQNLLNEAVIEGQTRASARAGALNGLSKSFRLIMQSLLLGLGAFLALRQEISPGMMIAGSLLLGRALAPIDMLVATWKNYSAAISQYNRLRELLTKIPSESPRMTLPSPQGDLLLETVAVVPPGGRNTVVTGVSFQLEAGEMLGVVGPSASGKSTLVRAILGIWPTYAGKVRLDGADISAWDRIELGSHIGYLPQDIELFDGTIAENISRFRDSDSSMIVDAAKLAGVHDLILRLPQGYDTIIGSSGGILSGGQRQRIALARAVFGNPKLLVLDEPNSNLDDHGEKELVNALQRIKAGGCSAIVVTNRTLILQCVDKLLVLKDGVSAGFGPRDEILSALSTRQPALKAASR